jgi:hypothetical protein
MRSYMLLHDKYLATDRSDWWLVQLFGSYIDTSHVAFSMVLLLRHTMRKNFSKNMLSQKFVPVPFFVTISAHHASWILIFLYFKSSKFDCKSQGGRKCKEETLRVKGAEILQRSVGWKLIAVYWILGSRSRTMLVVHTMGLHCIFPIMFQYLAVSRWPCSRASTMPFVRNCGCRNGFILLASFKFVT